MISWYYFNLKKKLKWYGPLCLITFEKSYGLGYCQWDIRALLSANIFAVVILFLSFIQNSVTQFASAFIRGLRYEILYIHLL